MRQIIKDEHFKVTLNTHASSVLPHTAVWDFQHVTVAEELPGVAPPYPGEAVIKHQLGVKHFSVLEGAYALLFFEGFPHSTAMQWVRHQDMALLVQSGRYTGKRFCEIAEFRFIDAISFLNKYFYFRPMGEYRDRQGKSYLYGNDEVLEDLHDCYMSCVKYARRIKAGWAEEHARDALPQNFRQNFAIGGTIRGWMHVLDQRTLADSQAEAQTAAWMALDELKGWSPTFFQWYEQNRAGKNLLAP
jgi:thymidylate synthase (FAD)